MFVGLLYPRLCVGKRLVCFLLFLSKNLLMKLAQKLVLSLALVGAAGIVIYILTARKSDNRRMLNLVADEGYETAHDVLFPNRSVQGKNLHFGPVIPE